MNRYQEITEARKLLELPETATMEEIKAQFRELMNRWHPDKCNEDTERCKEMSRKIIAAYEIIVEYCKHYNYSFTKKEMAKYLSGQEWWM